MLLVEKTTSLSSKLLKGGVIGRAAGVAFPQKSAGTVSLSSVAQGCPSDKLHSSTSLQSKHLFKTATRPLSASGNVAWVRDDLDTKDVIDNIRIYDLAWAYRDSGFLHADTDPLGLPKKEPYLTAPSISRQSRTGRPDFRDFGLQESDLDKKFKCVVKGSSGFFADDRPAITLRELIQRLEETYCGTIGVECGHINDPEVRSFMFEKFETQKKYSFDKRMKQRILTRSIRSQMFEEFCATKFPTAKRFGVDGSEAMIVAMKEIKKRASAQLVDRLVCGMPHRGRLNFLMNIMHKPLTQILLEFRGIVGDGSDDWGQMGDVKYHLGTDFSHHDPDSNREISMTLLPNPSHLEAVDPLVLGYARAEQYYAGDAGGKNTLTILLHGDASVAGQGVVYETLQMSQLPGFSCGGTIHLVVNNQIGFTTNSVDSGSGFACTSIAKSVEAPIFHVNADDPEAVTFVSQVALDYRQKFGGDVFINLIGYRRFGHNELDMPKFTQPRMYDIVGKHPKLIDVYTKRLLAEGTVDSQFIEATKKKTHAFYNARYEEAKKMSSGDVKPLAYTGAWKSMKTPSEISPTKITGIEKSKLMKLGNAISTLPADLKPHPNLAKLYAARVEAIRTGKGIDFGLAEAMAYASLCDEGFHVRLAGQDCERGTFSHRHAVLHDQEDVDRTYSALKTYAPGKFEVWNSLLSEYAALGYEFGYALANPNSMSVWEAQFGDFANGAQIIIDQFLTSAEVKWRRQNGLTLLLPHGYDGQGPEHSSGRIERFLQLADDREDVIHPDSWFPERRAVIQKHNVQVVVPTTPANHFHVLRRQMVRDFRKPLVVFSPKKLLKLREAVSSLDEMAEGRRFRQYIADETVDQTASVKRLILCSGQIYYDLISERKKLKRNDVAIARVEQLSPFPYHNFIDDVGRYRNLQSVVWAQEEPMNQGAWSYASRRIASALRYIGKPNGIAAPIYVGRDVSGAPAVGTLAQHQRESAVILRDAFDLASEQNSFYEKYMPA